MTYISFTWKELLIYGKELKIKKKNPALLELKAVYAVFKEYMN